MPPDPLQYTPPFALCRFASDVDNRISFVISPIAVRYRLEPDCSTSWNISRVSDLQFDLVGDAFQGPRELLAVEVAFEAMGRSGDGDRADGASVGV